MQKLGCSPVAAKDIFLSPFFSRDSSLSDQLIGNEFSNVINGGAGDDVIIGFAGDATLSGGSPNDNDILSGGDGDDKLYAKSNSTLYGGNGSDVLFTYYENNLLYGDAGEDTLVALGDSTLFGGTGNDYLECTNGNNRLYGEDGNDRMVCDNGSNVLYGGAGSDTYFCKFDVGDSIHIDLAGNLSTDKDTIKVFSLEYPFGINDIAVSYSGNCLTLTSKAEGYSLVVSNFNIENFLVFQFNDGNKTWNGSSWINAN